MGRNARLKFETERVLLILRPTEIERSYLTSYSDMTLNDAPNADASYRIHFETKLDEQG